MIVNYSTFYNHKDADSYRQRVSKALKNTLAQSNLTST